MNYQYAAKLLFQFRVVTRGRTLKRRVCEERVVLIRAKNARDAMKMAQKYGVSSSYEDSRNQRRIYFEFIGVMDLSDVVFFDADDNPAEVWWEYRERIRPMEKKRRLLKPETQMRAFGSGDKKHHRLSVYAEPIAPRNVEK